MTAAQPMMLSALIPAYNSADTIGEALASVAAQTVLTGQLRGAAQEFEVVVVDDASTDGTVDVVEKWLQGAGYRVQGAGYRLQVAEGVGLRQGCGGQGGGTEGTEGTEGAEGRRFGREGAPDVLLIRRRVNGGPAAARNEGIAAARGEWIAFLDGDDAWLPWRLESQFDVLALFPDADLICADITDEWTADADPARVERARCEDIHAIRFVDENPVGTSTVLARRKVLVAAGLFDERFRGPEDLDLWMRVAALGRIVKLSAPLVRYRERAGSLSMSPDRFLPQILAVYDKAFAAGGAMHAHRRWRRRAISTRLASAAWTHLECGCRGKAAEALLRSWLVWPLPLKVEMGNPLWRLSILVKIAVNRRESGATVSGGVVR